jgi:hypothetical protein
MLITVLPFVVTCLVVQACRSLYMGQALRYCHCLYLLGVRVSNALVRTIGGFVSVIFSAVTVVLARGFVGLARGWRVYIAVCVFVCSSKIFTWLGR